MSVTSLIHIPHLAGRVGAEIQQVALAAAFFAAGPNPVLAMSLGFLNALIVHVRRVELPLLHRVVAKRV
jgi:hypothetical protein